MKNLIPYKGRLFNVAKRLKFGLFSKTMLFLLKNSKSKGYFFEKILICFDFFGIFQTKKRQPFDCLFSKVRFLFIYNLSFHNKLVPLLLGALDVQFLLIR